MQVPVVMGGWGITVRVKECRVQGQDRIAGFCRKPFPNSPVFEHFYLRQETLKLPDKYFVRANEYI